MCTTTAGSLTTQKFISSNFTTCLVEAFSIGREISVDSITNQPVLRIKRQESQEFGTETFWMVGSPDHRASWNESWGLAESPVSRLAQNIYFKKNIIENIFRIKSSRKNFIVSQILFCVTSPLSLQTKCSSAKSYSMISIKHRGVNYNWLILFFTSCSSFIPSWSRWIHPMTPLTPFMPDRVCLQPSITSELILLSEGVLL